MVRTVVDCKIVLFAVDCELSFADAVAVATYKSAEEWFRAVQEIVDAVVSLDYIGKIAVLVGNHEAAYCTAVICDCNFAPL